MKPGGAHLVSPVDLGLDPTTLELLADLIAERVAARLAIPAAPTTRLVDAATLAAELGLSRTAVYAHADELGAVRLGDGRRPRLRFDVATARDALSRRDQSTTTPAPPPASRRPRTRPATSAGRVLQIRQRAA